MALTTVKITGTFNFPDASWAANTQAEFMISGYDTDTEVVVPDVVKSTLGSAGELDVDLWGNDDGIRGTVYRVNIVLYSDAGLTREVKRIDLGRIQVSGDGPLDIASLLDSPVSVPGAWYSTITEDEYNAAIQAVDDAQAWAESSTAPGGPGTKSSKTWAIDAAASADRAALYATAHVDTFSDLANLTASDLDEGDYAQVTETGAVYERAADAASDEHLDYSGSGGVKWYVLPTSEGYYVAEHTGAPQDETTGADKELSEAMIAALAMQRPLHLGAAKYINGQADLTRTPLTLPMTTGQRFSLVGAGAIVQDRDGLAESIGKWNQTFSIYADTDQQVEAIHVEGVEIDKQGGLVTVPGNKYEYEQSHCLRIYAQAGGAGTARIRSVTVRDVITRGKVGGGIVLAAGAIDRAHVLNCHGLDDDYVDNGGSTRADVEFQATIGNLLIEGCTGGYIQSEPNASTPLGGISNPTATLIGCKYKWFDLVGYSDDKFAQTYNLLGCQNGEDGDFWCRNGRLNIAASTLRYNGAVDFRNAIVRIENSTIVIGVDTTANEFNSYGATPVSIEKNHHYLENVDFIADATADGSTTGYAAGRKIGATPIADVDKLRREFVRCRFDAAFEGTANAYRNGTWVFRDCAVVSRAGAAAWQAGTSLTSYASRLTIDGCDLSGVSGYLLNIYGAPAGATDWWIKFQGEMDYAKFSLTGRPVTEYQDTNVIHEAVWLANARPDGHGLNGMTVRLRSPVAGSACEWVCTAGTKTGSATFAMTRQAGIATGGTASRPTPHADDKGLLYFDTDFGDDGLLIVWDGTAWVPSQQAAIADMAVTATSGTLPTPDGSVTIADASSPTNAELLEYCAELEAKTEDILSALRSNGLIAT